MIANQAPSSSSSSSRGRDPNCLLISVRVAIREYLVSPLLLTTLSQAVPSYNTRSLALHQLHHDQTQNQATSSSTSPPNIRAIPSHHTHNAIDSSLESETSPDLNLGVHDEKTAISRVRNDRVLDSALAGALTGGGISWTFRECTLNFSRSSYFTIRDSCCERVVFRVVRSMDGGSRLIRDYSPLRSLRRKIDLETIFISVLTRPARKPILPRIRRKTDLSPSGAHFRSDHRPRAIYGQQRPCGEVRGLG